ncbi:MAG: DinB family protein [Ginsengibacter sp.]
MIKTYRKGAVGALLDEYERALAELKATTEDISNKELIEIVDATTEDPRCRSIQTILSHVINSGYSYAIYIRNLSNEKMERPQSVLYTTIKEYHKGLDDFFAFTKDTFKDIQDVNLEEFESSKKILAFWGQVYDIEQITEHAIVHILRHRRQIEKFKIALRGRR